MQECARCRDLGHSCPGTFEEDGQKICVFCLDLTECPVQRKQKRGAKKPPELPPSPETDHSEKSANEPVDEENNMLSNGTDTPKICKRRGCETQLSDGNRVGLCRKHVRWTAPGERTPSLGTVGTPGDRKAGNSVGKPANGHALRDDRDVVTPAKGSNGNGAAADFLEDRLNMLILSLPVSDKAKIVDCWIRGQL
jgi:hypothetical protein